MATGRTGVSTDFTKVNYSFTWYFRVNWSETYDVSTNTSDITITSVQMKGNWSGRTYNGDLLLKVSDGTTVTTALNLSCNSLNNGVYNASQDSFQTIVDDPGKTTPVPITATVRGLKHSNDGTGTVTFSLAKNNLDNPTLYSPYGSATFNAESKSESLTTIPRASSFTTSGSTIGSNMTISISRASSSFTHRIYYRYNSTGNWHEITTDNNRAGTSWTWAMPASLGESIPTAFSGTWQIGVETYNGSTQIGTMTTKTVTLTLPANCGPTGTDWCSASYTNTGTVLETKGITNAVAGYSKLTYSIDNTKHQANYGATISSRKAYVGATEVVSGTTKITAASTSVRFVVTDSRGKTLEDTKTVTAYAYAQPTLSNAGARRCSSSGTASDSGTYWYAIATANVSGVGGQNSYTLTAQIKPSGGSYGAAVTLTSGTKRVVNGNLSTTTSYTVRIALTDTIGGSVSTEFAIPTQSVTLNFKDGGSGAAFGGYANTAGLLDVNWDLLVRGNAKGRVLGLGQARDAIPSSADLNSYTEPGVYAVESDGVMATLSNKPTTGLAGVLIVYNGTGTADAYYISQKYIEYQGREWSRRAYRTSLSGAWTWYAWRDDSAAYPREDYVSITGKSASMRLYKIGKLVVFDSPEDITSLTGGSLQQIGTLPSSEWYPARTYRFPISNSNAMMFIQFDTDGKIYAYSTSTLSQASNFSFNGCYITT